jgi:dehydrogenase/reductase SDR family protein 7B
VCKINFWVYLLLSELLRIMKDKVVIITGGSSGIGKALSESFSKNGSRVLITGRSKDDLLVAQQSLKTKGLEVAIFQADVSLESDNRLMVEEALRLFGQIDVLINNAGISMRALFEEFDLEAFKKVMGINFYGAVYATKHALPHILKSKGSIVGISSINGKRSSPARSAYSASKFAMEGFLEALRTEVMKRGVHVLVASPGFTASNIRKRSLTKDGTPQGDSPRKEQEMMTSEEVADRIYKAVVNRKRDLVLSVKGNLAVWINKWWPTLADKIVYNELAKEPDSPFK